MFFIGVLSLCLSCWLFFLSKFAGKVIVVSKDSFHNESFNRMSGERRLPTFRVLFGFIFLIFSVLHMQSEYLLSYMSGILYMANVYFFAAEGVAVLAYKIGMVRYISRVRDFTQSFLSSVFGKLFPACICQVF